MTNWNGAFAGQLDAGEHCALLLVDPVQAYVTTESPLFLKEGQAAIECMSQLVAEFRNRNLPVIWTGVRYKPDGSDGGQFFKKVPALKVFAGKNPLGAFPDKLAPAGDEQVFIKQYPSAFFETLLAKSLREQGVDTLFVGGFSTSGCVRASVLDALQHGFIPFTIADACADRSESIHNQNLRDLGMKYSEILDTDQAIASLNKISSPRN